MIESFEPDKGTVLNCFNYVKKLVMEVLLQGFKWRSPGDQMQGCTTVTESHGFNYQNNKHIKGITCCFYDA